MTLPEDLKQLLLAFNAHKVEYLVVGAYVVGAYAEPRATKDIDLFIRSEIKNSEAVYRALAEFGAPLAGVTPADFRDDPKSVFQLGMTPARADLLQHIDGVNFDEAWEKRAEAVVDGIPAHVISPELLIWNKLASGRLQIWRMWRRSGRRTRRIRRKTNSLAVLGFRAGRRSASSAIRITRWTRRYGGLAAMRLASWNHTDCYSP